MLNHRCNYLLKSSMAALAFLMVGAALSQTDSPTDSPTNSPVRRCTSDSFPALTITHNTVGISFNGVGAAGMHPEGRNHNNAINSCIFDIGVYDSARGSLTESRSGLTIPETMTTASPGATPPPFAGITGVPGDSVIGPESGNVNSFWDSANKQRYLWIDDIHNGGMRNTALVVNVKNNIGSGLQDSGFRINFRLYREVGEPIEFPTKVTIHQSVVPESGGVLLGNPIVTTRSIGSAANGGCVSVILTSDDIDSSIRGDRLISLVLTGATDINDGGSTIPFGRHGGVGSFVFTTDLTNDNCDIPLPANAEASELEYLSDRVDGTDVSATLLREVFEENYKDNLRGVSCPK